MNRIFTYIHDIDENEYYFLSQMTNNFDDSMFQQFMSVYTARRKQSIFVLLLTLIGFFGFAGMQRFYLEHVGFGVLYLLTCGLCFIGTIVDAINYKKLTSEANLKIAQETYNMLNRFK